jgi:hypothetical protein
MGRLIAFGCSMTYGQALPDCFVPPYNAGPKPSKYSWISLVAELTKLECVNLAKPGSSNKRIAHDILNFKFLDDDTVFIQWTYPNRTTVIESKNKAHNILPNLKEIKSLTYYRELHSPYDSILQSKLYIHSINMLLKSKNINVYNLVLKKEYTKCLNLFGVVTEHIPLYLDEYERKYPRALDKCHIGIEGNSMFAKDLLCYIGVDNVLPTYKKLNVVQRIFRDRK